MNGRLFPDGFHLVLLEKSHQRSAFDCGEEQVNNWLRTKALQNQKKRLSSTKVLLDSEKRIAGFYTLATGQVDFSDLPIEISRKLPQRPLPIAVLAWLGVSSSHQKQGLGTLLLAHALRDCHRAGETFAFVALIIDCINDSAKAFYQHWNFTELPGYSNRFFLSAQLLSEIATSAELP